MLFEDKKHENCRIVIIFNPDERPDIFSVFLQCIQYGVHPFDS